MGCFEEVGIIGRRSLATSRRRTESASTVLLQPSQGASKWFSLSVTMTTDEGRQDDPDTAQLHEVVCQSVTQSVPEDAQTMSADDTTATGGETMMPSANRTAVQDTHRLHQGHSTSRRVVSEPASESASEPVSQPASKRASPRASTQRASKRASQPVREPASEPVLSEPASEPVAQD